MATIDFPRHATSHQQVSAWRTQAYLEGLLNGSHERFVVPVFLYCNLLLFTYLLTPSLKGPVVRYGVFAGNFAVQLWTILNCRSPYPVFGLIIGFFCGWNILWSANLLVFNNARDRFKKIKRVSADKYEWQSLPRDSLITRLGWAADLVFNSRGIGWDWKVSGEPSRPPQVEASLRQIDLAEATKEDRPKISSGRVRYDERSKAISHYVWVVVQGYLWLDGLKTITNRDPYFWGILDAPPPASLPTIITASPTMTAAYRITIALLFVWQALNLSFAIPQLLLLGLFTPETAGTNAEAWLYPDQFGDVSTIPTRGLAGFWGGFWHHLFRHSFQSSARALSKVLGLKPKSPEGAGIELITSFNLSGILHTAASMTMLGPTQPWFKMYAFFALQPVGILAEVIYSHYVGRSSFGKKIPKVVSYTSHIAWTCFWLFITGQLLAHELTTGGVFLYEPVPFSIFRGLGFGAPGDTLYCWSDLALSWHYDSKRPWLSGIVI
ncbi:hypothetical protein AMS68_003036 [Peltaster fructicola]|uniref:Wax synthase domain-containing protein n=1 Tax=Peltaster fructicola TaxID=286661 RepID=A0A6H0XSC0_9PEZI|nr:hypothetical protein AMS68_003036 [Peltaster fructicola]